MSFAGCPLGQKEIPSQTYFAKLHITVLFWLVRSCKHFGVDDILQISVVLTHWGLVTPYGERDLGQYWLRQWLVAWWYQAITWTSVDSS